MAKSELKFKARRLRSNGESIKVIAKILSVSQSTASLWCRDVKLSSRQIKELERRAHDPRYGRRLQYSLKQQRLRIEKTQRLIKQGIKQIGKLGKKEVLIAGVSLYWAEGFKKDHLAGFCNSDPDMVKFFLYWLKNCFGYRSSDFRLRVGINEGLKARTNDIEEFWSSLSGIPRNQFQKPFYQKVKWQKKYDHPENYHGVLRIRIRKSTDFLRMIKGYIEGLKINSS